MAEKKLELKNKRFTGPLTLIISVVVFYLVVKIMCRSLYSQMVVNMALVFCLVAYSVSVMLGMCGELSFAGVAFMGIGAFTIANLTTGRFGFKISPLGAFLVVIPVATFIAFLIGLILLRLKGTFFSFSTIALVQVAYTFFNNYRPLFGGVDGISGIPSVRILGKQLTNHYLWFPYLLVFVVFVGLVVEHIRNTQLGRSMASCRDNETAARVLGVNVYMTKVIAFTISGVLSAMGGALYSMLIRYASADMFTYDTSAKYIIMAMFGGVQSTIGVFIGALIVQILPQVLKVFQRYFQLIWGVSIILLMVFMPEGLTGIFRMALKRRKSRKEGRISVIQEKGEE